MRRTRFGLWALFLVLLNGCSGSPAQDKGEEQVRQAFASLQAAVKARDGDKIWNLLDADSQAAAERAAQSVQTAFTSGSDEKMAELEKGLGLSAAELATLKGPGFVKSERFYKYKQYYELPESDLEKVNVTGDRANVVYIERDDNSKEKLKLVRQNGAWKFSLEMPRGE